MAYSNRMKAPDVAYDYLQKNNLLQSVVRYVLNWKNTRKAYYLRDWINNQMKDALRDEELTEITKEATKNYYKTKHYDYIMTNILRFCRNYGGVLKYKTDMSVWKVGEYWQTYKETFDLKTGDCEDGAIFMYCMARSAGVPANRLLIVCGDVQGGGHAWLAYRAERDPINLRFLDWCYWVDTSSIATRKAYYINGNKIIGDNKYLKMWWCFNEKGTYIKFKPTFTN